MSASACGGVRWIDRLIRWVATALMWMLALVVMAGAVDLAATLVQDLLTPPVGRMEVAELLRVLGLFLVVLIAIELVYVVRLYLEERHFDVEVVLVVALIAIARKVVVFDLERNEPWLLLGISAVVISLAAALFLLRWSRRWDAKTVGGQSSP
ncbi:MAG: phosphate-starvation-inducible PsiE family protein [Kiritimatiellae bacterium]|nr:phosphate-starvation-inducible PsiE family protein [Kiritimatiellia bacterium]